MSYSCTSYVDCKPRQAVTQLASKQALLGYWCTIHYMLHVNVLHCGQQSGMISQQQCTCAIVLLSVCLHLLSMQPPFQRCCFASEAGTKHSAYAQSCCFLGNCTERSRGLPFSDASAAMHMCNRVAFCMSALVRDAGSLSVLLLCFRNRHQAYHSIRCQEYPGI